LLHEVVVAFSCKHLAKHAEAGIRLSSCNDDGRAALDDFLTILSAIPGGTALIEWFLRLAAMSSGQRTVELARVLFLLVGLFEFIKYLYRWIFKRRSRLEEEVEVLEHRVNERNDTITKLRAEHKQLTAELKSARNELPGAAIARAEHEMVDRNQELAIAHLEKWFFDNAGNITAIAKHLARHHIARAVPDPADHLQRARDLLRLARGASPEDEEAREISAELDSVNAALQEQLLREGDRQIAWNSAMARGFAGHGEALLPIVTTLRDIARWCFENGLWRLTPLFADRASDLALQAGPPLRRVWCQVETQAAFYQGVVGHSGEALNRIDRVLAQARAFLPTRDAAILDSQFVRSLALRNLGHTVEALAEIDAFAPIQVEVQGERHTGTLNTRYLRAQVLSNLGRCADALAEIDAFAPIQVEVLNERHPDTLNTRYLRAEVLSNLGHYTDALLEINAFAPIQVEVRGERHPDTLATRHLRARVLAGVGRCVDALAEIDAFTPIQVEVRGERNPNTLATRCVRAQVLDNLGHYADALAEIDAFTPIQIEVQGGRHPNVLAARSQHASVLTGLGRYADALAEIDTVVPIEGEMRGERHPGTLTTRYLRACVLHDLGRSAEALAEIDAFAAIQVEVQGERHPGTLTTRYLRARVLSDLGRHADALAEIGAFAPVELELHGKWHPSTLATRSLRIGIEIAEIRNIDHAIELRGIISDLRSVIGEVSRNTLLARYRLARLLFQQGRSNEAHVEISDVITRFDPATAPGHILLRSAKALRDMIEGRPVTAILVV
jgi:hypothetical protein